MKLHRIRTVQWTWPGPTLLTREELRHLQQLPDGTWLGQTRTLDDRPGLVPRRFISQCRLWHRYLQENPMDNFQLKLTEHIFAGARYQPAHWTIDTGYTTPGLGQTLTSYEHLDPPRGHLLLQRLGTLRTIRRTKPYGGEPVTLYFSGDILLECFGPALGHVQRIMAKTGQWLDVGPTNQNNQMVDHIGTHRFLPDQRETLPRKHLTVYCQQHNDLICRDRTGEWVRLQLPQPLYRYAAQLHFGWQDHSLVLKQHNYHMPDAWLNIPS